MVINIPLAVDTEAIALTVTRDLQKTIYDVVDEKVTSELVKIARKDGYYTGYEPIMQQLIKDNIKKSVDNMIIDKSCEILEDKQDQIINEVCDRIARRLINRKKLNDAINITLRGIIETSDEQ